MCRLRRKKKKNNGRKGDGSGIGQAPGTVKQQNGEKRKQIKAKSNENMKIKTEDLFQLEHINIQC